MNKKLQNIFDDYNLGEKDRHEYMQIFSLLSWEKKKIFLDNAPRLISEIADMRKDLALEQEFLMCNTLSRIQDNLYKAKQKMLFTASQDSLTQLRQFCE